MPLPQIHREKTLNIVVPNPSARNSSPSKCGIEKRNKDDKDDSYENLP